MSLYDEVRAALRGSNFRPRKSRGQNFLIHERVIEGILNLLDLDPSDSVVEIGPGLGFLTRRLLERAQQVWAIELDRFLAEHVRCSASGADPKLHLIQGDFLQFAPDEFLPKMPVKLAGNLPYSVATAVLFRIFEIRERFSLLVLMLQREVADRIIARPGTKEFGALSVWCQIHGRVTDKLPVSPEAFFPRPKVRSMVLKFQLFPEPRIALGDFPALQHLLRAAFGQRRKTLGNALQAYFGQPRGEIETWLRSEKIDPRRRGETLSVDEFIALAIAARRCVLPLAQTVADTAR
ncbi:MAG TPA: 16S rRNA (adenine(1518)-N(6)/adenine(1519)-N(6))-dimethyltransferase RsmA [Candidatus Binatia bacterium]